ncbi:3-hydroxyacyl-CoA dehydrogenase NAD-binding domain-containing protein [Pseudoduganella umbonata]|uniref:3-hydroxyacyl-CoA dehydrogenase n=1 Tax=Pseudoduganella umbonata TaxID=864828 RepID=A0A4P8HKX8_9BURK|nr:3-hydroxyacyl-CoA dehydrogenase NAD-binding domain-containing protein [Pseudoduganella umbonata]MBB3221250.1 3-hydroxyacyl-CoA dehydrogenase [Pseudoduganella umbonata]QCP10429.1 hypothetical protein FCL38_08300 [Pseudoduganella umbonata]
MSQYQTDIPSHATQANMHAVVVDESRPHAHRREARLDRHRKVRTVFASHRPGSHDAVLPAANDMPRQVGRVGVIGAGSIGIGLAMALLDADIPVALFDPARAVLDGATASLRSGYEHACTAGELTAAQRDRRVALLAGTVNLHHLKDCDVIVDVMGAGKEATGGLVRRLNEVARQDVILVTRIAACDIDHVASLARHPENVLGFHLAEGADATLVWEFVAGKATSERTVATAAALVQALHKSLEAPATRMTT